MILSVDPGEKRIGVCLFSYDAERKKANLVAKSILGGPKELYSILTTAEGFASTGVDSWEAVVCENYRIRPPEMNYGSNPYSRSGYGGHTGISAKDFWSEVISIRVIGAMEFFAYRVKAKFILQEPKVLAMARKWCDMPGMPRSPKGHIPDDLSAYIHGAYYMMNAGMIRGTDDIIKFGQEPLSGGGNE